MEGGSGKSEVGKEKTGRKEVGKMRSGEERYTGSSFLPQLTIQQFNDLTKPRGKKLRCWEDEKW